MHQDVLSDKQSPACEVGVEQSEIPQLAIYCHDLVISNFKNHLKNATASPPNALCVRMKKFIHSMARHAKSWSGGLPRGTGSSSVRTCMTMSTPLAAFIICITKQRKVFSHSTGLGF